MGYGLINGAPINGADTQSTEGIDLVSAGQVMAVSVLLPAGAVPLEFGQHRVRSGTDVALKVPGQDLVRAGIHGMLVAQPAPSVLMQAEGAYPLEVGEPGVAGGTITLQAAGAAPLEMGVPAAGMTLSVEGARPLELGVPEAQVRLEAVGARALEVGTPSLASGLKLEGLDLVRAGVPSIVLGAGVLSAAGAWPLELGEPGMPTVMLQARQAFPLSVGRPWIDRGSAC